MHLIWILWFIAEVLIKNTKCDISEHLDKDNNLYGNFHNTENDDYSYDHNSILRSEEARKFYGMSPTESKEKFSEIIDKMDINHDGSVEMIELKTWINNVYNSILNDDVNEQWKNFGQQNDNKINFDYYVSKTFGSKKTVDHLNLINKEQRRWMAADLDNDKLLNKTEFFRFLHPEEFKDLKPLLSQETLDEMDTNKDSVIDINEYLGFRIECESDGKNFKGHDMIATNCKMDGRLFLKDDHCYGEFKNSEEDMFPQGRKAKEEWIRNERQNFGIDRDLNKDGVLDRDEIQNWLLPDSYNRVESEAQHLMDLADKNKIKRMISLISSLVLIVGRLFIMRIASLNLTFLLIFPLATISIEIFFFPSLVYIVVYVCIPRIFQQEDHVLSKSEMLDKYQVFVGSRDSLNYGGPNQSHEDL